MKQLLLVLVCLPLLAQGQVKEFPYHPDEFKNELGAFMKANNNEEGKNAFELYDYTYDLRIYEFRYNIISIISGRIGLMYAR